MALEGVISEKCEDNNVNVQEVKANGTDNKSKQIDPNTAFLRAARAGQLDLVVELLDSGAVKDINSCNSNGLNALHLAAKDGHISVVEELLKRGAIVDSATKKGNTALHIACLAGQEDVARALLAAGARADSQSAAGFTPLYMAAQENHAACVKMLLAAGASQTLATEDGFTPLAVAMQQGHDRVVAELLESDTRGKVRLPALHIAAKKNDVKAASLLLKSEHNPDACSKSGFTPLHIAAHYGNVGVGKALLAAGADAARAAKHCITPLHVACKWGQLPMLDLLIEHGANIAAVTRDGLTPMHCAARSGHSNVVARLLHHSAPITSKTKNGLTPLHMSVQGEHVETAKVLLTEGAPIDDVTVDYLTALHVAAHCGHVKVAKLLLDRNADANARALNGFTPLHIACKKNRLKVVELLLKYGASKSSTTESGLTPLHVAAFMGCMNIAIHLLQAGADADTPTARGETPLHLAARAQQTDLVRILLRNGAKVEARAREEQTPLHVAARLGHADIAALLLQHGAQVAACTTDTYTPLHIAAKEGKEEVASILLEQGAPIEAETRKGFTPLHLAAKYGDMSVARTLLARGASGDKPGKSHITPLHMATYYGHPDIALLLLDKGASPHSLAKNGHSALHIACRHNHPDIAFALLEHGADPSMKSKAGFTPLHMAAQAGHEDCVEMLIERGADVNVPANNGLTALHLAGMEGRVGVARALVAGGAALEARTRDGYSPLHAAAHSGHLAAARALLDAGADVSAKAHHQFTPLHQAAQQGHTLIIQLLLKHGADPNALSANGQTACAIADRLGYISAVEALRPVTENTLSQAVGDSGGHEGKYRVAAPELMQDTFMSDSEDEGGEVECPIQQQQQYRYMNSEAGTLHRARPLEDSVTDGHLWPSNNDRQVAPVDSQPVDIGFLVSFVVDARGGAMRAKRRGGVRVIVPPAACAAPTRVTCRAATRRAPAAAPPPLMEGEALASRLLELQPQGAKFLAPVVIEVPIFTSPCRDREIVILRSDTGETWQDHYLHNNDNPVIQEALAKERSEGESDACGEGGEGGVRVTRIVTCDFPHYLAVVSRIRQEVHIVGPEGGTVSSAAVPQVQAVFPSGALTKRIRVGLQAHAAPSLARALLPRHAAVSPVLTVEPRRRKFHKGITLTAPLPAAHSHDKNGNQDKEDKQSGSLRLLCSIMGGQARAVWEDVTGSTPLTLAGNCASFTTTVSARFWLMNCQNVSEATKLATDLYKEMLIVPFEVRIVVLGKRLDSLEGRLLVLYITDKYTYDTLIQQEHYTEIAQSTSVSLPDGKDVYLEFSGNLVPVTKSGTQPSFHFEAFKDNRIEFPVRVKHHEESPSGRIYFMNEPKVAKGEQGSPPLCVLDVALPERVAPRPAKSQQDCLNLNLDQSGFDALKDELSHWGEHNNSTGPASLPHEPQLNGYDKVVTNGDIKRPERDSDAKDRKPHLVQNGDASHMDTNKTKATFDSDEDKTPFSTLEKNKKRPDNDDSAYDTPKAQPRTKADDDNGPPSPAPRLIKEDLLDKVEDMFKTLGHKPHDELNEESKVYNTKLIVDEGKNMYENATPVQEELIVKQVAKRRPNYDFHKAEQEFSDSVDRIKDEYIEDSKINDLHIKDNYDSDGNDVVDKWEQINQDVDKQKHNVQAELHDHLQKADDYIKKASNDVNEKVDSEKAAAEKHLHDLKGKSEEVLQENKDAVEYKLNQLYQVVDGANDTIQKGTDSAKELIQGEKEKAYKEIEVSADELLARAENKKEDLQRRISEGMDSIENTAESHMERIRREAETATDEIKRAAEETLNAAAEEKARINELQHAAHYDKADLTESYNRSHDAALSAFDKCESSAKDTYADIRDDYQNLESSAQDTLHSFQSSAGNTFDSLDDSVKDFGNNARELFADVGESANNTFEGFQVVADNKLQDVCAIGAEHAQNVEDAALQAGDHADQFASNLNDLGNSFFGGLAKSEASTKLLDSEKAQSSPHKKGSGIPKLKKKKK